jgi:hypothetical protein
VPAAFERSQDAPRRAAFVDRPDAEAFAQAPEFAIQMRVVGRPADNLKVTPVESHRLRRSFPESEVSAHDEHALAIALGCFQMFPSADRQPLAEADAVEAQR